MRVLHLCPGTRARRIPYMGLDEVMAVAQAGREAGCTEALFTLGERPELRYDEAARWLAARGYQSTVDYVANAAQMVLESTGLLPHANAGALYRNELSQLRTVAASQGMMIESLADLAPTVSLPTRSPSAVSTRCVSQANCVSPLRRGSWWELVKRVRNVSRPRGHRRVARGVRSRARSDHSELPAKPRTAMAKEPAASDEEFHWTIAVARIILPDSIHLQAPPNLSDDPTRLLAFGIDDFAESRPSPRSRQSRARVARPRGLGAECDARGFNLEPRLNRLTRSSSKATGFP